MTYYVRNLPHWHPPSRSIFLTWRLHGSLPAELVNHLKNSEPRSNRRFARAEQILDKCGTGPRWLADPEIADAVAQCIRHGAEALGFYDLLSFVVMPNHVHLLIAPKMLVQRITKGIKGVSGRAANRILSRKE